MKSYIFKVVVEPDEDVWTAYCPVLKGTTTWGHTKEEAIQNIQEVVQMVIESMIEHGEPIPEGETDGVQVSEEPVVAVTV